MSVGAGVWAEKVRPPPGRFFTPITLGRYLTDCSTAPAPPHFRRAALNPAGPLTWGFGAETGLVAGGGGIIGIIKISAGSAVSCIG